MSNVLISIIIRTFNEEQYLNELLSSINTQDCGNYKTEVIIVDSGSTDKTIEIATQHNARITHIDKNQFTFGKSLNIGCDFADGDILVFISGHCIPTSGSWLKSLVKPIIQGDCDYAYGCQVGRDKTKFSEHRVFEKYYPQNSSIHQDGFFCNNANAAIAKNTWAQYRFNEVLTGLEDMYLAKEIHNNDGKVGYVAESIVYHIHNETWSQVKTRYERESIALQKIMPEIKISLFDMLLFITIGIIKDMHIAFKSKVILKEFKSIVMFRTMQYYGSYRGNHLNRELSYKTKMRYFYPRINKN